MIRSQTLNYSQLRRQERRERFVLLALAAPASAMVLIVLILPVGWLFYLSFVGQSGSFSLENYARLVDSEVYIRIFWTTFKVSFLTTSVCVLIGYPLAYLLSQVPTRLGNLLLLTVLLPFWTSLLVRTYAWLVLLQRRGLINEWGIKLGFWEEPLSLVYNLSGTLIGMVHIMLPFLVLPLFGAMKRIDRDYMNAASNLGASPTRAFWRVFVPLSLPGLLAGSMIVFILCLGFFVTPAILGGGKIIMVSNQITDTIELFFNWGAASALGVVLLLITLAILAISSWLVPLGSYLGKGH